MSHTTPARRVSIDTQTNPRNSFAPLQTADLDDDLIVCDPYSGPARMRNTGEVTRLLSLIDSLDAGKDGLK